MEERLVLVCMLEGDVVEVDLGLVNIELGVALVGDVCRSVENVDHFFGVAEAASDVTKNVGSLPNLVAAVHGEVVNKYDVGDSETKRVVAINDKKNKNDNDGGIDSVEDGVAEEAGFGDVDGSASSFLGVAEVAFLFVVFAGEGFDVENVGNGVGEGGSLFAFGFRSGRPWGYTAA